MNKTTSRLKLFTPPETVWYRFSGLFVRFINAQCIRTRFLHKDRLPVQGPAVIAVTHLSHLEPFFVSLHTRPPIHWMTRIEFYRKRWARWLLNRHLNFPVNRQGPCIGTMRHALRLMHAGKVAGIFPEGGVAVGQDAAIRGGPIKLGACFIAQHADVPVVPVVVVGTHKLNCVSPWLPQKRGNLWMAVGEPLFAAPLNGTRREQRRELGRRLVCAYQALYQELLAETDLTGEQVP